MDDDILYFLSNNAGLANEHVTGMELAYHVQNKYAVLVALCMYLPAEIKTKAKIVEKGQTVCPLAMINNLLCDTTWT